MHEFLIPVIFGEMSMKYAVFFLAIIGLSLSANAGDMDAKEQINAAKQIAIDTCVSKATEAYGSAEAVGKAKRKRLNSKRGYRIPLRTGERSREVYCFVSDSGDVSFYK